MLQLKHIVGVVLLLMVAITFSMFVGACSTFTHSILSGSWNAVTFIPFSLGTFAVIMLVTAHLAENKENYFSLENKNE